MSAATFKGPLIFEDAVTFPAASISPASIASTTITSTASSAVALTDTTAEVALNATTGTVVISTASSRPRQLVFLRVASLSGGAYTLVVTGGTLTLNSVGEAALIQRSAANDAWLVVALTASSATVANIATIV